MENGNTREKNPWRKPFFFLLGGATGAAIGLFLADLVNEAVANHATQLLADSAINQPDTQYYYFPDGDGNLQPTVKVTYEDPLTGQTRTEYEPVHPPVEKAS